MNEEYLGCRVMGGQAAGGATRSEPLGLNMLVHTPRGDVFTMKDYRGWLKAAGFRTVKAIRTPSAVSPLILARR